MIEQMCVDRTPITPINFNVQFFRDFLLNSILTEILHCEIRPGLDGGKSYNCLTAIGKLMHGYYLVQVRSDDISFENMQIIQISLDLFDRLLHAIHPKW